MGLQIKSLHQDGSLMMKSPLPHTRRWIAVVAVLLIGAAGVAAQVGSSASTQPTPRESFDRLLSPDPRGEGKPLMPTPSGQMDVTSGNNAVAPDAPQVRTKREGTMLVDRVGRLARSSDASGWDFVFDADAGAMRDPPMRVIPNLKLMGMEDAIESTSRDLRFRVSGMLTEYRGRNYILFEKVIVVSDANRPF